MSMNVRDKLPLDAWEGVGALTHLLVKPRYIQGLDLQGYEFAFLPDTEGNVEMTLVDATAYDPTFAANGQGRDTQHRAFGIFAQIKAANFAAYGYDDPDTYGSVLNGRIVTEDVSVPATTVTTVTGVPVQVGDTLFLSSVCPQLRIAYLTEIAALQGKVIPQVDVFMTDALRAGAAALGGKWDAMLAAIQDQWSTVGVGNSWQSRIDLATQTALAKIQGKSPVPSSTDGGGGYWSRRTAENQTYFQARAMVTTPTVAGGIGSAYRHPSAKPGGASKLVLAAAIAAGVVLTRGGY